MVRVNLGDKKLLYGDCQTTYYDSKRRHVEAAEWQTLLPEEKGTISVRNLVLWKRGNVIGLEKFENQSGYVSSRKHRIKDGYGTEWRRMRLWVTSYKAINDLYFNLKTGFFYLRRKRFKHKNYRNTKRSLVDQGIVRNPVRYLSTLDWFYTDYRRNEPVRSLAIALGVTPRDGIRVSEVVWEWFANFHGIKYSDNWKVHAKYYPLMGNIRKAGMNMTRAILEQAGIYSKLTNKLLNSKLEGSADWHENMRPSDWKCVDPGCLVFWVKLLGDLFPQLDHGEHLHRTKATSYDGMTQWSLHFDMEGEEVEMSRQEKLRLVRCSHEIREHELRDHIHMRARLLQAGVPVTWMANNRPQFMTEHEAWSQLLGKVGRAHKELVFPERMVSAIENLTFNGWQPVILKSTNDYDDEGKYQRHCVGGYVDYAHRSFIVSLRHPDGRRITNEVTYEGDVLQSRGKCNTIPFDDPDLAPIMKDFVNEMQRIFYEDDVIGTPEVRLAKNPEVDNYLKGLEHLASDYTNDMYAEGRC